MQNNKIRINNLIFIIIVVLLLLVGVSGGIYLYLKVSDINIKIGEKQTEINAIKKKLAAFPDLEAEVQKVDTEYERMSNYIPSKEGQSEFIKEFKELAENSEIKIKTCKANSQVFKLQSLPDYNIYQWDINFIGEYQGLLKLINFLPKSKRFIKISKLVINKDEEILNVLMTLDLITKPTSEKVIQ